MWYRTRQIPKTGMEWEILLYEKGLVTQCLSHDLETGCLKLAVVKSLGIQIFKGVTIYSYFNHKHVYIYQNKA